MKLVSSKEHFRNSLITVVVEEAVDPEGHKITRAVIQHPGSAVIMPVDARGRILLVRQYRLPVRRYMWELPGGVLDPGESPLKSARRELEEETGFRARRWTKLASFYPSPGYVAEHMTIYLAEELEKGKANPGDDEWVRGKWFTAEQVEAAIRSGRVADAKTIIGFLSWKNQRGSRKVKAAGR
ncbi:MAG: NUDIX hydrolase [Bryobacteraceae bacterium]